MGSFFGFHYCFFIDLQFSPKFSLKKWEFFRIKFQRIPWNKEITSILGETPIFTLIMVFLFFFFSLPWLVIFRGLLILANLATILRPQFHQWGICMFGVIGFWWSLSILALLKLSNFRLNEIWVLQCVLFLKTILRVWQMYIFSGFAVFFLKTKLLFVLN